MLVTPSTVDPAEYNAEDWLDVEDRHLHKYMEAQCAKIAAHIRGTRAAWKRLATSGIKLTETQKLAMLDEGNPLRVAAKAELATAPEDLRAWDVPEDLRKQEEPEEEVGP